MRIRYVLTVGLLLTTLAANVRAQSGNSARGSVATRAESYRKSAEAAREAAEAQGWPAQVTMPDGTTHVLVGLHADGRPRYDVSLNLSAAVAVNTAPLWDIPFSLDAAGQPVGVWDVGSVRATHQEFGDRVYLGDPVYGPNHHATHVAGIVGAAGVNPLAKGMAPAAALRSYHSGNDAAEMTNEAAAGMLVSNHSYGSVAGFTYNSSAGRWQWHGAASATEDSDFGYYSQRARQWDEISYDAPNYLIVKAAGNDRGEGPSAGETYYEYQGFGWVPATTPRAADGPYDCLPTYANAKNILLVGAAQASGFNTFTTAPFSSWGPTDDGRVKPDLIAPGVGLLSAMASNDEAYAAQSGTSMAAPVVTGSLALVQQRYGQMHGGTPLRAATLKGVAIHTARPLDGSPATPNYQSGWGMLDATAAVQLIEGVGTDHVLLESHLPSGAEYRRTLTVTEPGPLKLTLSWTDVPGETGALGTLDDPTLRLVNDLDLRLIGSDGTHAPFVLNPAQPSQPATTGDNFRDNVEKIYVAAAAGTYTLVISHKGALVEGGQDFSLLVSGAGSLQPLAYCAPSPSGVPPVYAAGIGLSAEVPASVSAAWYTDLSATTLGSVTKGEDLTLYLRNGSAAAHHHVWIDYNQNQSFDPTEYVGSTALAAGAVEALDVPISPTVAAGVTRLRVLVAPPGLPVSTTYPCQTPPGATLDAQLRIENPLEYCDPAYSFGTPSGDFIQSVWLNEIANVNTGGPGGGYYNDYTQTHTTTLVADSTYELSVQNGTYGGFHSRIIAWIDYNRDGTFEASERLGTSGGLSAGATYTFTFQVPTGATAGNTRLRIRQGWFINPAAVGPCGAQFFGEAEDYGITLTVPPPPHALSATRTSAALACPGDVLTVAYEATGPFNADNAFILELSNTTGQWADSTLLISGTGGAGVDTLSVELPPALAASQGYRWRLRTTSPALVAEEGLTVAPTPSFALGADTAACGAVVLTGPPAAHYLWSTGDTTAATVANATGVYWLEVQNAAGCTFRDSLTVTVDTLPLPAPVANAPVAGDTLWLSIPAPASGATYAWAGPHGWEATGPTASIPHASDSAAGTYTVTAQRGTCTATDSVAVTITAAGAFVQGKISTETTLPIAGVTVRIEAETEAADSETNTAGEFLAESIGDGTLRVTPRIPIALDGGTALSVLDLILVQRHILHEAPLDAAYRVIAADVNGSASVTTLDLALIRAVMLGAHETFPIGRHWQFVRACQQFDNPNYPFPFDTAHVVHADTLPDSLNFVAVRLGDVDQSYGLAGRLAPVDTVGLDLRPTYQAAANRWAVPVRAAQFDSLSGFQLSFKWNPGQVSFDALVAGAIAPHFVAEGKVPGSMNVSWVEPTGQQQSWADTAVLFTIYLTGQGLPASPVLSLTDAPLEAMAYNDRLERLAVVAATSSQLEAQPQVATSLPAAQTNFSLAVYPNPARGAAHFRPAGPPVGYTVWVYNGAGQLVARAVRGRGEQWTWSPPAAGLYVVRWQTHAQQPQTGASRLVVR